MVTVHETSIIGDEVSLGKNVTIGAYNVITGNVQIGDDVVIHNNCVIGAKPDQPKEERLGDGAGQIVINRGSVIKDFVTISLPTLTEKTEIGELCYLMSNAYIAHDCTLGPNVVISHGARLSGYTKVGKYSNIGAGAVTHQKTVIGDCVMVGANCFVKGELMSGLIYLNKNKISGINNIGIENSNLSDEEKLSIAKDADKYIN